MKKPKTKSDIIEDMSRKKEISRKRELVVERFYPALVKATISVDESKALISAMASLLMEQVLMTMKDRKFSEVMEGMKRVLCQDNERVDEITGLLETLKDENLLVAREIIEGTTRAVEAMITEEMRSRKLDTLKTNWDSYLN